MKISHSKKQNSIDPESFPLEVWGGLECTVVRIGDGYRNQINETGHAQRLSDLDRIAELGIKTVRYPVVWETVAPDNPDMANWEWHDGRLARLQELGITPIAGLLHHGSGPKYTSLLDPAFPELLAGYAEQVALRYPWLRFFTPVNEPLTTARFSALYGHWYPHGKSTTLFLQALVNQCRAVVLCMQAIRKVIPEAQLVQTEDLGKVFSTPLLQYQADYENERRWLSFDLLCGRVNYGHSWYQHFIDAGITPELMDFFVGNPCKPDIVGINHYLTSERFLDHELECYPAHHHGGNGQHRYADAEAVRVDLPQDEIGPYARLREAWERYRLPIVVTEAHHGCTRDEQLRWLIEVWNAARRLQSEGADIRAVTVWSLFGAIDWNTLLVQKNGFYEAGAFDIRGKEPRPTALAMATTALSKTGNFDHPVLDRMGWWKRDERFYRPVHHPVAGDGRTPPRKLLITGATGTLGQAFSRICKVRGLDHALLRRTEMDISDPESVEQALATHRPWAVINTAGYVRVVEASRNKDLCYRENSTGADVLARACAKLGIPLVTFSSDLVFDGKLGRAYVESDATCPACVYGNSKADAEQRVLASCEQALVIRTSAFFGPWDQYNFVYAALRDLAQGKEVRASESVFVSPTYVPDLVHATLDLLIDGATGVWHLTNQGSVSWAGLAIMAAKEAGIDTSSLIVFKDEEPRLTSLTSERGLILPTLQSAIRRFMQETAVPWQAETTALAATG